MKTNNYYILILYPLIILFLQATSYLYAKQERYNLLQNPSFETWSSLGPSNWIVEDTNYGRVSKESIIVFHGNFSAKLHRLQVGTGNNRGLLQQVTIPGRGRYIARVRFFDNTDSISGGMTITWRQANGAFITSWSTVYTINSPSWQVVERNAVTDTAPTGAALVDFLIRTYGTSTSPAGRTIIADLAYFAQQEESTLTTAVLVSPNGGENWVSGTNQIIRWHVIGSGFARCRLLLSRNSGSNYTDTIAGNVLPTETTYQWIVPLLNSNTCRVLVQILDASGAVISQDASDGNFTIQTSVTVISPNGGEVWPGGTFQTIKWRTIGTGFTRYKLLLSRNSGSTYSDTIVQNVAATETTYLWSVPPLNINTCRIMVQAFDGGGVVIVQDASNGDFAIRPILTLISPNGGEIWSGGSNKTIKWLIIGSGFTRYRLLLSRNSGSTWTDTIANNVMATDTTYQWIVPFLNLSSCRIMCQALDATGIVIVQDMSDGNFTIQTSVTVISPNGGEIWFGGSNQLIKWTAVAVGFVRFRLLLSRNSGLTYPDTISHNVAPIETLYNWLVPNLNFSTCRVMVQILDVGSSVVAQDASNTDFMIITTAITENLQINRPYITMLYPIKSNPVINGSAKISFSLAEQMKVSLKIYTTSGELIKTLVNSQLKSGVYDYSWNCFDKFSRPVAAGIYFGILETPKQKFATKLLLIQH